VEEAVGRAFNIIGR